jgi:hypothetical protein
MLVGIRADESYNRFLTIANNASSASPTINPGQPPRRAGTPGTSILFTTGKPQTSGPGLQNRKQL